MGTTPNLPSPVQASIHGPYEDLAIAGIQLIEKLIEGQSPEQRIKLWQNWIDFWQPLMELGKLKIGDNMNPIKDAVMGTVDEGIDRTANKLDVIITRVFDRLWRTQIVISIQEKKDVQVVPDPAQPA